MIELLFTILIAIAAVVVAMNVFALIGFAVMKLFRFAGELKANAKEFKELVVWHVKRPKKQPWEKKTF